MRTHTCRQRISHFVEQFHPFTYADPLFIFRDQVFGDGFSVAILKRLAVLMERQEQPVATVVRRKGAVVDKVSPFVKRRWSTPEKIRDT